jgi:hypothetical protein
MGKKTYPFWQKLLYSAVAVVFMLVLVSLVGEFIARLTYEIKPEAPPPYNMQIEDELLGWKCKPNYVFNGEIKDENGKFYPAHYSTNDKGFKAYCAKDSLKDAPKIWFIGDSYIQSVEVSSSEDFFRLAADKLGMNLFACGMSGWGCYQKYLVLDKYFEEIKPDIVVIQVCTNDFTDNYEALEDESIYRVNERRPYLRLDGSTYYAQAGNPDLCKKSRLFEAIYPYYHNYELKYHEKNMTEYKIPTYRHEYRLFDESVKVTSLILQKIQARIGKNTKLYILDIAKMYPFHEEWQELGKKLNIPIIGEVSDSISEAKSKGISLHTADAWHWTPKGHSIAAQGLVAFFQKEIQAGKLQK